ncbi:restriction endonuclease subunit S [Vibrio parahaemolyticus]|uniref:restriction endonuclease subunit S n=1 Tax=Vibrio parahaemolyticus TaxID=670 RepID=UPI001299B4E3|nr:restriction endonuclease subunit S [Vibrio parahaemolyticus]EJB8573528.1 restriction endonuclease subunit S [Vibrio parahaemolyticus]ELB2951871.1 restriction endonuclease subunit S [Vibrio parahaemolyticus]MCZ6380583.1 restriction endonuclease subunit S [Vibrio parahaemolyticus]MRD91680.1 hypothetical protein [Vibrio parahaemolyticus]
MIKTTETWTVKEFGDIVSIKCPKFDPKSQNERRKCIELEHIEQQSGRIVGYTNTFETTSTKNVFSKGDVLFGKLRPYLRKFAQAPFDGVCSSEIWVFTPQRSILNDFLYYLIQSDSFLDQANKSCGTKMPRADWKVVSKFNFLLPPLVEQQKIAEVLSTVDKKIDLIEQKIAETEKLKTGLMQKLFSEGVGVQDENGDWQPHTEFQKTPIGYLPEQWSIKSLEDVCKVKGGKRLPKGETLISEKNEHPYIRVSDMFMGGVALNDIQYVPEHVVDKIKNYTIGKNDLFISVAGTLGIVGKVPEQLDGANLTENADKLTDIKCNIDYMYYYLCSEKIQSTIDKLKTVGAQPKLALTRIKQFTFIEPSPKEQQKIATILSSVDQKLELLRTQKSETQQLKKGLMQKLLTGEWRVPVEETEAA